MGKMKEFFDAYSVLYRNPAVAGYFQRNHRWVIKALPNKRRAKLLDIGCGTGDLMCNIFRRKPDWKIYGIDISTAMLRQARQKNKQLILRKGDVHHLPFPDNTFDIVTNTISFHHYENPLKALLEMYRVLKPGGVLLLLDSVKDPCFISILPWYWDYTERKKCYTKHLFLREFKELFRKTRFIRVDYKRKYRFWPVIHVLCIAYK